LKVFEMNDAFLDRLTGDLEPVRRIDPRSGWAIGAIGTAVAVAVVVVAFGLRDDVMAGEPSGIVLLRAGALLLLGFAALAAVVDSARPRVGRRNNSGWKWALAGAALFPAVALAVTMANGMPMDDIMSSSVVYCFGISSVSALAIGGAVTGWLRRGAVTALERTGWLTGLAAGAFGTFAYSLHCPSATITYIGLWYTLAIALCAVTGRLVVPQVLRW
jgi:hypothetical protein